MTEARWLELFSRNLIEIMERSRTTQKELAEGTGLSQATISRYLNRERMPSISALINISEYFGETLDDLMYFGEGID